MWITALNSQCKDTLETLLETTRDCYGWLNDSGDTLRGTLLAVPCSTTQKEDMAIGSQPQGMPRASSWASHLWEVHTGWVPCHQWRVCRSGLADSVASRGPGWTQCPHPEEAMGNSHQRHLPGDGGPYLPNSKGLLLAAGWDLGGGGEAAKAPLDPHAITRCCPTRQPPTTQPREALSISRITQAVSGAGVYKRWSTWCLPQTGQVYFWPEPRDRASGNMALPIAEEATVQRALKPAGHKKVHRTMQGASQHGPRWRCWLMLLPSCLFWKVMTTEGGSSWLEKGNITPIFKKGKKRIHGTTGQLGWPHSLGRW